MNAIGRRRARGDRPLVALAADPITRACLSHECDVIDVHPRSLVFPRVGPRPDLLLVESAWEGWKKRWKFKVAAYPDHPKRSNADLARLVARARDRGIPTVFWNKEDGVHFERFIGSARLFEHIFTVDENCVPRYREVVEPSASVEVLTFPVQPAFHSFSGVAPTVKRANFVGSYSRRIHEGRRANQHMLFASAAEHLGLTVWDRNSGRTSPNYRYPEEIPLEVRPAVPHAETAGIYKAHLVSLNVNTVTDSPTMYSRRLVEILACGGLAVTTPARSVERLFSDFCHVVSSREEAGALFARLAREGLSPRDREMMEAGAEHVARHYTWSERLSQICRTAGVL